MFNDADELDNIIVLTDELGNEVEFEFLDLIKYIDKEYVVLYPLSDDDENVVILELEYSDGDEESFCEVENENIVMAVFKIFKEKFKDKFNFYD